MVDNERTRLPMQQIAKEFYGITFNTSEGKVTVGGIERHLKGQAAREPVEQFEQIRTSADTLHTFPTPGFKKHMQLAILENAKSMVIDLSEADYIEIRSIQTLRRHLEHIIAPYLSSDTTSYAAEQETKKRASRSLRMGRA